MSSVVVEVNFSDIQDGAERGREGQKRRVRSGGYEVQNRDSF